MCSGAWISVSGLPFYVECFFIAVSYLLCHFHLGLGIQPTEEAGQWWWWWWFGEEGRQQTTADWKLWHF